MECKTLDTWYSGRPMSSSKKLPTTITATFRPLYGGSTTQILTGNHVFIYFYGKRTNILPTWNTSNNRLPAQWLLCFHSSGLLWKLYTQVYLTVSVKWIG